jgi:hypothetical protein
MLIDPNTHTAAKSNNTMSPRFRVNRGWNGFLLFVASVLFGQQWQKGDKLGNRWFYAGERHRRAGGAHTPITFLDCA